MRPSRLQPGGFYWTDVVLSRCAVARVARRTIISRHTRMLKLFCHWGEPAHGGVPGHAVAAARVAPFHARERIGPCEQEERNTDREGDSGGPEVVSRVSAPSPELPTRSAARLRPTVPGRSGGPSRRSPRHVGCINPISSWGARRFRGRKSFLHDVLLGIVWSS